MRRGIAAVQLPADTSVSAPASGIQLGIGHAGPVLLRLFRLSGTSITLVSGIAPAQLVAVRAAAAGTPVQVLTGRPDLWQAITFSERLGRVYAATDQPAPPDGPSLLVDDRPPQSRRPIETVPWQCRLDVRTEWTRQEFSGFAYSDLTVFGGVPAELVGVVAATHRIPTQAAAGLAQLEPGVVGVARRGTLELVRLNPTAAESAALDPARGARPVWR